MTEQHIATGMIFIAFILLTAVILTLRLKIDLDGCIEAGICLIFSGCAIGVGLSILSGPFSPPQMFAWIDISILLEGCMLFLIWPVIRTGH